MPAKILWTIGHSTRTIEEFSALLLQNRIRLLVDVRLLPGSRKYPHFNQDALKHLLKKQGVDYLHMPGLGGRRKKVKDSPNTVWRNASFRAYADYMETPEFKKSAEELMHLALERNTCIMCSEAVWWRCHRSMIADYFKSKGWNVQHILSEAKTEEHPYTKAASIIDGQLEYGAG